LVVEQIGSGITRIRAAMNDEGLTPPEFNIDGMFTVTLRRPFDFEKWVEKVGRKTKINYLIHLHKNCF
jgi:ATP-dependent DNA helicase RecG